MDEEFDAILADYLKAQDRNAAPSQDEMLLRHPRHREALAAFFDGDSAINCLATDDAPIGELLPVGITFAGCRITGTAGIGGSGVVYEAEQLEPRRPVALKVLSVGSVPAASAAARFRQEAELTARLHHPRIVPIHAFGVEAGRPYLILAWLPGGTAAARLHEFPIVPAEAASVVRDVAAAVAHAHENAVLHRDLKPANILFDERGSPCLADFGFAAPLVRDLRLTQAGTFAGTAE